MWVKARCKPNKHGFIFLRGKLVPLPPKWSGLVEEETLKVSTFLEPIAEAVPAEEHTDDLPIILVDE